jgi:hypothetical protein
MILQSPLMKYPGYASHAMFYVSEFCTVFWDVMPFSLVAFQKTGELENLKRHIFRLRLDVSQ